MKLSTYLPYTGPLSQPDTLAAFARAVESMGYTWVRVGEHILYPKKTLSRYPYAPQGTRVVDVNSNQLELFSVFSYLAGQTRTLRFQSGVVVLPLRSPFITARSTATLDYLSGGRFCLEIGVGWMRDEFDITGVPFDKRGEITDESLAVLRTLFEDRGAFEGKHFSFPELNFRPLPVQRPFPIYVGGGIAPAVLKRIAVHAQGWSPMGVTAEEVAAVLPQLGRLLAENGRALSDVDVQGALPRVDPVTTSAAQYRDDIERLADLGFSSLTVDVGAVRSESLDTTLAALEWAAGVATR